MIPPHSHQVMIPLMMGPNRPPITEEQIKTAQQLFDKSYDLPIGTVIMWKPGMRNCRLPEYGEAAIVVDYVSVPMKDETSDVRSSGYNDELNVLVGCFTEDGTYHQWWMDDRRFMPYDVSTARDIRKAMAAERERQNEKVQQAGQEVVEGFIKHLDGDED